VFCLVRTVQGCRILGIFRSFDEEQLGAFENTESGILADVEALGFSSERRKRRFVARPRVPVGLTPNDKSSTAMK